MTVTVLCDLRPHPDRVDRVLRRSIEQLSLPSQGVTGRRFARLFQHVDDPTWLLYLAEWSSRETFEAYRQSAPMPGTPDEFQSLPVCRYFQRLALFERALVPFSVMYVDIASGPAVTHAARRDRALAYLRSPVRTVPGLSLVQIHEAVTDTPALAILTGWDTASPAVREERGQEQALLDAFGAHGGTVERFIGRKIVETTVI